MGRESRRRKNRTNYVPAVVEGGKPQTLVCSANELKDKAIQAAKDIVIAARASQLGLIAPNMKQIRETDQSKERT